MLKTLSSPKPLSSNPAPAPGTRPPTGRRRALPALCAGAALLALVGAGLVWRSGRRAAVAPAPTGVLALQPTEARLLAEAAREPTTPRPYLELAEEYAATGRPASGFWACGEAAARAPGDPAIRLKLAALGGQLGQPQSAETTLRAVLAGGGATAAQARLDLADLLLATGRPTEALAILREAGPEADVARGRAHEAAGHTAAAADSYRRAVAEGSAEACERLARLELAIGHLKAAQEAMRSLSRLRAPQPEDLLLVAAIRSAAGTPRELDVAAARLRRCIELRPRSAEAHYQAGLLLLVKKGPPAGAVVAPRRVFDLRQGNRAAAALELLRAVKLDPNHAEARRAMADVLQAMGQTARARLERAAYFELKDQPDRAVTELRRAGASRLPDDRQRTLMLVRLTSDLRQVAVAVKEAQAGLQRHPGDPQLMLQLGLLYQPGEWRAPLEQLCREWMAREPASGMPYWLLGRQAVSDVRVDDAIRLLTTACAKEPERSDFCSSLALAYLVVPTPENYARARPWLEKAVALNPRAPGPHQHLGRVLEHAGDLEGARRQYLQSLDLQPAQTTVLNSLAQLSTRLGRREVASLFTELARAEEERTRERRRLVRLAQEQPADPAPRLALARLLLRNGQLTAARNQLERAAELRPAAAPARKALAEVNRLLRVKTS
jgi:tetratricopeptide (TPR) repeat protein